MAHKTLVGGTAYEVSGGKTLVNGTAYSIKNGKTLVGGTAYEVGFGKIIEFTLAGNTYSAEDGMTWSEWEKSDYCPVYEDLGSIIIKIVTVSYYSVSLSESGATIQHNGVDVMPDDVIIDGVSYETFVPGFDW